MSAPKRFRIERLEDCVTVEYFEDKKIRDILGRPHDVPTYRMFVKIDPGPKAAVWMQHLDLSDPPYTLGSLPGRSIDMAPDEFSAFVDGLVALRDHLRASAPLLPGGPEDAA